MGKVCEICGGMIFAFNQVTGYAGAICTGHPAPAPILCDHTSCKCGEVLVTGPMPTGPWVEGDEFAEDGYHLCECDVKPSRMQYQVAFAEDGEAVNSVSPILRHAKIRTEDHL